MHDNTKPSDDSRSTRVATFLKHQSQPKVQRHSSDLILFLLQPTTVAKRLITLALQQSRLQLLPEPRPSFVMHTLSLPLALIALSTTEKPFSAPLGNLRSSLRRSKSEWRLPVVLDAESPVAICQERRHCLAINKIVQRSLHCSVEVPIFSSRTGK